MSRTREIGRPATWSLAVAAALSLAGCMIHALAPPSAGHAIIPAPVSATVTPGERFEITAATPLHVNPGDDTATRLAEELAALLGRALDTPPRVQPTPGGPPAGAIHLATGASNPALGEEGYGLTVARDGVRLVSNRPAGLFYGFQTLRHLLPPGLEYEAARPRPVSLPAARVTDYPRYAWRGAMLDVARHFFDVDEVKRYIDLLALYKINRLHLHLSDDQGWRIEIASWPNLAKHGGSTAVGGGPGGYYTQADYAELVAYARDRFITIVPEIDVPSHINAALASYPELNCDGVAPPLYTGIEVGFSTLCVDKDVTYRFLDDVVREIAAITPGPWFHLGGDEVKKLTPEQYARFIERMQGIVQAHGKVAVGWDEIVHAKLLPTTIVHHWRPGEKLPIPGGTPIVLSPANRVYLDMKYHAGTTLGLNWAGNVDVEAAYAWDPASLLPGVSETAILGVEAPLWSETLTRIDDIEYMAFPRLPAVAEVAWSPGAGRRWSEFRERLGAQAPLWSALGINAYWSPAVDWQH
jgi:hexosaminidase